MLYNNKCIILKHMLVFHESPWRYFISYDMYTAIAPGFFLTNIEIRIYCIKYEVYHKRFSLFAMANGFYPTRLCPLDKAWR